MPGDFLIVPLRAATELPELVTRTSCIQTSSQRLLTSLSLYLVKQSAPCSWSITTMFWKLRCAALILVLGIAQPARSFNVDVENPMIFNGSQEDMFGYTVKQFENEERKWLLIGSPWEGQSKNRTGDVYKCPVHKTRNPECVKLNLAEFLTVPNITEVKENMTLGMSLASNPKAGFLTCGPLYSYKCGGLYYVAGACLNVSANFKVLNTIAPTVQACKSRLDIVIVLDGSNSIYPWSSVTNFLIKLLEKFEIGPQQTQVGIMQYAYQVKHEISLNEYKTTEALVEAAKKIERYSGNQTMTALGINYARKNEFTAERGMRAGVSKVMVVITDGESHDSYNLKSVIQNCTEDNIRRFSIAVLGSYIRENQTTEKLLKEVESIASDPKDKHFFNVSDENALVTIAEMLGEQIFALEATGDQQAASFEMEMSQVGFSTHYTEDNIMLGAVGAYDWNGTVVLLNDNGVVTPDNETFIDKSKEVNEPLAGYLGYSLSSVSVVGDVWYVAGQPRYNHTGQVIIYTSKGQTMILQTLKGEQIGSYFGSAVCAVDIDKDSFTDILLVGAPMYMGSEKEEQGRVYVYNLKEKSFHYQMMLEPLKQHCGCPSVSSLHTGRSNEVTDEDQKCIQFMKQPCGSRFGTALTAVSDLDLDNYNDVVIGAPLEDNHQGAVYLFHGSGTTINKKYSQRISASAPNVNFSYFGQSIDGQMDLNDDGLIDITVGALGGAALFWSRDIAQVTISKLKFQPNKINIQNKNCVIDAKPTVCIAAEICFNISLKSAKEPVEPVVLEYNITIDSTRLISRGLFNETDARRIQGNITLAFHSCTGHVFYMLDAPDFLNPVEILVKFALSNPKEGPVLDASLPNEKKVLVPFSKDCGEDEECINDLTLSAQADLKDNGVDPHIVKPNEKKFSLAIKLINQKENAYNSRIVVIFSENIYFAEVEQNDQCMPSRTNVTCKVGYPFLAPGAEVSFTIKFEFNTSHLLGNVDLCLEATSDSSEQNETLGDNKVDISIPVLYEAGLFITRTVKDQHFKIAANDTIPDVIKSIEEIGDAVDIIYMIHNDEVFPISHLRMTITFPYVSPANNTLLYLTGLTFSSNNTVSCHDTQFMDPLKIQSENHHKPSAEEEHLVKTVGICKSNAGCANFFCTIAPSSLIQFNMSLRIWKPSFVKARFNSIGLDITATLTIKESPLVILNKEWKRTTITLTVSKESHGGVPIWVIILSVLAGLLLLSLVIFALWMAGFFRRPLKEKM